MKLTIVAQMAVLLISLLSAAPSGAQTTGPNKADWLARLNAIGQGDWRSASGEVGQLCGLAPRKASAFIAELWPNLTVPAVKSQLLKAMFNAEHPDSLRIARLAVEDKSPEVWDRLRGTLSAELAMDFGEKRDQAKSWLEARQSIPYSAVRRTRIREMVSQLRSISKMATSERDNLLRGMEQLFRNPELGDFAVKSGLLTAAHEVLVGAATTPELQVRVLRVIAWVKAPDSFLRSTVWPIAHATDPEVRTQALIALGNSHYLPAYELIKTSLVADLQSENTLFSMLAKALGGYGDPDAIPFLIGLIAADNNRTKYDVGYFVLGRQLTGAPYSSTHDGNWWRIWWERNRAQLPANVRDLPIPEFAHSRAYQDPLPRAIHLNPALLRDHLLEQFTASLQRGEKPRDVAQNLADLGDPAVIPTLIGAIAADNTLDGQNRYDWSGLMPLTGVPYSPLHDGNWWKLWWESHRNELPSGCRDLPIPSFPRTKDYREPFAGEIHKSVDATREALVSRIRTSLADPNTLEASTLRIAITELNDPRIVPEIIALMPTDPKNSSIYWLTYFGIGPLNGVKYSDDHAQAWWKEWWRQNESEFKKKYALAPRQPDFVTASYKPEQRQRQIVPSVTEVGYEPQIKPTGASATADPDLDGDDIKDISSERYFARGDKNKLYRLVGYSKDAPVPAAGYKLLVVLPGGDGSEEFRWFVRRIKKYALPASVLVAELIAPKWSEFQANVIVWPTRLSPFYGMKFPTEQFIEDVIADACTKTHIDRSNVCTLAWSSSGPAVYTHSATAKTHIRGAFIAMSVFRPGELPDPSMLKDRRIFVYHSPQDFIKIQQAKDAVEFLTAHGAKVKMQEYQGGHGWSGDTYGDIRRGVDWLFKEK